MKFIDLWRVKQNSEAKYPKYHSLVENIKNKFKISSLANQETQRHNKEKQTASLFCVITHTILVRPIEHTHFGISQYVGVKA